MDAISKASKILGIDEEALKRESLKAYLKKKLREYYAEKLEICRRYNVRSAREFEDLYRSGKLDEENTLDDFFKLDHLETQIEKIKMILRELCE